MKVQEFVSALQQAFDTAVGPGAVEVTVEESALTGIADVNIAFTLQWDVQIAIPPETLSQIEEAVNPEIDLAVRVSRQVGPEIARLATALSVADPGAFVSEGGESDEADVSEAGAGAGVPVSSEHGGAVADVDAADGAGDDPEG